MTNTIRSQDELSLTTTSSVAPLEAPVASSAKQCLIIVATDRFGPDRARSGVPGSVAVDDYVAELETDDEWADELRRSRIEFANQVASLSSLMAMRLCRGLSQRQLAEKIGASQPQIARLEQGKGNPEVATLRRLARELNVRIDEVLLAFERSRTA